MFRIQNIRFAALLFLLILTAMSYYPAFSNTVTIEGGVNPLNRYIAIVAVLTFLLYFNYHSWFSNRVIKTFIFCAAVAIVVGFLLAQMNISSLYEGSAREIIVAFIFLSVGYNSKMSKRELTIAIIIYSLSVAFVSYRQLMQHAGGFFIVNQYLAYGKNTLGVMCAASCVSLLTIFFSYQNKWFRMFLFALYLFILILCISIRARAAFLTIFLVTVTMFYKKTKRQKVTQNDVSWVILGVLVLLVFVMLFPQIFHLITDYINDSFYKNREGDITSGRESGWIFGLGIIHDSPLFGNLLLQKRYDSLIIHNFLIRQLSSFGIIGSLPVLFLYLFLAVKVIKQFLKSNVSDINVGFFVFVILLIISLEEPTFPFAPGTGVILPFVLLGYSCYMQDSCKSTYTRVIAGANL